jgi:hypothetical protein
MIYIVSMVAVALLAVPITLLLIPVQAYLEEWRMPAALILGVIILITVVVFFTLGWLTPLVVTFLLTLL